MNVELQTLSDLRRHEGCRLVAYKDTLGYWTIGYGRMHGTTKDTPPITLATAEKWLREDFVRAVEGARRVYPDLDKLDPVRKTVLINMAFNLGPGKLRGFTDTLRYIGVGNYQQAALNMLDSHWAVQVKGRATELAKRMSTGKIEPKHLVVV